MPISHMHYSLLGFGFGCMHVEGKRVSYAIVCYFSVAGEKWMFSLFADIQEHIMYKFVFMGGDLVAVYCLTEYIGMLYQYTATYCLVTDFFLFLLSHCCGQSNKVVHQNKAHL
ncbi:hypothetical protein ACJX0J_009401 [Zea mays]